MGMVGMVGLEGGGGREKEEEGGGRREEVGWLRLGVVLGGRMGRGSGGRGRYEGEEEEREEGGSERKC